MFLGPYYYIDVKEFKIKYMKEYADRYIVFNMSLGISCNKEESLLSADLTLFLHNIFNQIPEH